LWLAFFADANVLIRPLTPKFFCLQNIKKDLPYGELPNYQENKNTRTCIYQFRRLKKSYSDTNVFVIGELYESLTIIKKLSTT